MIDPFNPNVATIQLRLRVWIVPIDSNVASSNMAASLKPLNSAAPIREAEGVPRAQGGICAQAVWPPASAQRVGRGFTALRSSRSVPLCLCRHRALETVPGLRRKFAANGMPRGSHKKLRVPSRRIPLFLRQLWAPREHEKLEAESHKPEAVLSSRASTCRLKRISAIHMPSSSRFHTIVPPNCCAISSGGRSWCKPK